MILSQENLPILLQGAWGTVYPCIVVLPNRAAIGCAQVDDGFRVRCEPATSEIYSQLDSTIALKFKRGDRYFSIFVNDWDDVAKVTAYLVKAILETN